MTDLKYKKPNKSLRKKALFKNINQFNRSLADDPMDTDEIDPEKNYIPLKESVVIDTAIDEEFLVETIDLIFNSPTLRNISVYSYAL